MLRYSLATRIRLELFRRLKYALFMSTGLGRVKKVVETLGHLQKPLVVTIAFNDAALVRAQIESFARESAEEFVFLLADNSPSSDVSRRMKEAVEGTGAVYVRLPYNFYTNSRGKAKPGRGSLSHSVALDWVWKYIVRKVNPPAVVVLDHDVFPLGPFSISSILSRHLAVGPIREGSSRWTTWPGLTFFRYRDLGRKDLTFTPSGDLDSGAGLWGSLYQYLDKNKDVRFMTQSFLNVVEGSAEVKSQIEIIDDSWLHLIDGSGWFDGVGKAQELLGDPTASTKVPPRVAWLLAEISDKVSQ